MKKILFFMPNITVGGAERVVCHLICGLGHKYKIFLAYIDYERPGERLEFPKEITKIPLRAKRTRFALFELYKILLDIKPDIVFSSWSRTNLLLLILRTFLRGTYRVIIREPNLPSYSLPLLGNSLIYRFLYHAFYPKADLIICQSDEMKSELIEQFSVSETQSVVIHNMITVDEIFKKSQISDYLSDVSEKDIISCGRLDIQKGYDLLITAFHKIAGKHLSARLIIFGEGPKREELENQIIHLGLKNKVFLPGHTSNPYYYMARANTYVSSSRWEGLPNTVLEAMACGTNILAVDCPGATSEIIQHGINGWLVEANNVESLSKGIDACLSGVWKLEAKEIVRAAYKFDASNVLPRFEQIILSVS